MTREHYESLTRVLTAILTVTDELSDAAHILLIGTIQEEMEEGHEEFSPYNEQAVFSEDCLIYTTIHVIGEYDGK